MESQKNRRNDGVDRADQIIDGGQITDIVVDPFRVAEIKKQKLSAARTIALTLILILAISVALHYGITILLLSSGKPTVVDVTERIFNSWLPVISGFAGAAVSYFFAKEK